MRIEILIYCYGAICLSMIAFNLAYLFLLKRNVRTSNKKERIFTGKIIEQMNNVSFGGKIDAEHLLYLNKKLSKVENLMSFDTSLEEIIKQDREKIDIYLKNTQSVFLYLAVVYLKKERMQSAYFAYFMFKYKICKQMPFTSMIDALKEYLKKDSLYCRHNAIKALCALGSAENVLDGLKVLEKENIFIHSKIVSEALLGFEGEHNSLISLLWEHLFEFKEQMQVSILNYIRFKSGDYQNQMLSILKNKKINSELHFCAIRYFGKYPYTSAYPLLIAFAEDFDELNWNYAAFSALSLASYPCDQTVKVLKDALFSSNWYVRYNAAQSLEILNVSYDQMTDVIYGNDRFAREMMMYRFDHRALQESM